MNIIQRAYKTELNLNHVQTAACRKHAGAARWAYNWRLARKQGACRTTGATPPAMDLHRDLNAVKRTTVKRATVKRATVPWMYEISKRAPQEAVCDLDANCAHCFRRVKVKQQGKLRGRVGYPQRKSRKHGLGGFRLTGSIVVFSDAIQLPRLGRLRPAAQMKLFPLTQEPDTFDATA
jgi:putative transposase